MSSDLIVTAQERIPPNDLQRYNTVRGLEVV